MNGGTSRDSGLWSKFWAALYGPSRDALVRTRIEAKIVRLNQLNQDLLGPGTLAEKMKRITDGVVRILDADFARVWLVEKGDVCKTGCMHAQVGDGTHACHDRSRCLHLVPAQDAIPVLMGECINEYRSPATRLGVLRQATRRHLLPTMLLTILTSTIVTGLRNSAWHRLLATG